jgi:hypothetical protein
MQKYIMKYIVGLLACIILTLVFDLYAEGVNMDFKLTPEIAESLATLPLNCIQKEYPNKPDHVINDSNDLKPVRDYHPSFYGCYDWHSSVHGHWLLVNILKNFPQLKLSNTIISKLNENLTENSLLKEVEYIKRENSQSFERPYGWAWLLKLYEELVSWDNNNAAKWKSAITPLANVIVQRYLDYFPKQTYPIRSGVHSNTAFGFAFALDYARAIGNKELENLIVERSNSYYKNDKNCPAEFEPNGNDFLSPCLIEADLMRRILPKEEFIKWFHAFLPGIAKGKPETLLTPAVVGDRSDPQIVHLDGLNLSRAWCMYSIGKVLNDGDPAKNNLLNSAKLHAADALSNVASGYYEGEHWLATFAAYMLEVFNEE